MLRLVIVMMLALYCVPASAQFVEKPKLSVVSLYYEGELNFLRLPVLESITGVMEIEFRNISDQPISQLDLASDGMWHFKSISGRQGKLEHSTRLTPVFDNRQERSTFTTISLPEPLQPRDKIFLSIEFAAVYRNLSAIIIPQTEQPLTPNDLLELMTIVRLGQVFPMPAAIKENKLLLDYEFKHAPFFFDLKTPFSMTSTSMNITKNKFSSFSDGTSITYSNGKAVSRNFSYNSNFLKKTPELMFVCRVALCRGEDVARRLFNQSQTKAKE